MPQNKSNVTSLLGNCYQAPHSRTTVLKIVSVIMVRHLAAQFGPQFVGLLCLLAVYKAMM